MINRIKIFSRDHPVGFQRTGYILVIFLEKKNAFSYTEKPYSIWDTAPKGEVFRGKTISHPVLFPRCPRAGLKSDYW